MLIEFEEIKWALRLEEQSKNSTSYASFFKTKGNRLRFFIILAVGFFSQWSGNGLISYYLTLILDSIGYQSEDTQTLINGILTIWNFVTTMIFALLVNRFKRRTMFLVSTAGMLITYVGMCHSKTIVKKFCLNTGLVWTGLEATYELHTNLDGTGNAGVAKGVLAMIFLYNLAFNIGWGPLQVTYVVEILPYNLRARVLTPKSFFQSTYLRLIRNRVLFYTIYSSLQHWSSISMRTQLRSQESSGNVSSRTHIKISDVLVTIHFRLYCIWRLDLCRALGCLLSIRRNLWRIAWRGRYHHWRRGGSWTPHWRSHKGNRLQGFRYWERGKPRWGEDCRACRIYSVLTEVFQ